MTKLFGLILARVVRLIYMETEQTDEEYKNEVLNETMKDSA